MNFRPTNCCGISEITSLSNHTTPEEAMVDFCKQVFGTYRQTGFGGLRRSNATYFYTYYMFTAAVYETGPYSKRKYGQDFADFILNHGLGKVATIDAEVNFAFHADHKVQAWLWQPDRTTLAAWWTAHNQAISERRLAIQQHDAALMKKIRSDAARRGWEARRRKIARIKATIETNIIAENVNAAEEVLRNQA
jgi:hypothetical protein